MRRTSSSTGDNKISVPRHRKQASTSADRQERAIETRERQEAQIEMIAELIEFNEESQKAIEDQIMDEEEERQNDFMLSEKQRKGSK